MNIEDLPPDLQARARAAVDKARAAPTAARQTWTCHTCEEHFTAWAAAERHSRATHHHRIDTHTPEETP